MNALDEGVNILPLDAQALLDIIRQRGKQGSPEAEALEAFAAAPGAGVVPADLRAALYKAAALIPGATVVDRQANLDGKKAQRSGSSVRIEKPGGHHH